MSRKSSDSRNGLADVIGVALLRPRLLLLVALFSFDRYDLSFFRIRQNHPHNWIGIVGAYLAWFFFLLFGVAAYLFAVAWRCLASLIC